MGRPGKRNPQRQRNYVIGAIVFFVILLGLLVFFTLEYRESLVGGDYEEGVSTTYRRITYEGKDYKYNDHISNFLFLGIDTREIVETEVGQADAGQADAVFLVSWDRVEGTITLISIPRDTMTEIEVFGMDGESFGMSRDHISLGYGFGDGKHKSCELMKTAVSNLLYGIPIQGYCAINLDGIGVLTDAIGGVEVVAEDDSLAEKNPEWVKGATIQLDKDNAETFVRYRNVDISQSAIVRLQRQQVFLDAYLEKMREQYAKSSGVITKVYDSMEDYMVSNIGLEEFANIAKCLVKEGNTVRWTIPGEGIDGAGFDEYIVDDSQLFQSMIQTFYKEVE